MIQNDIDNITSSEINNFSSELQSITSTSCSLTSIDKSEIINDSTFNSDIQNLSSLSYNNTEDDNIDWDFVSKQLEIKLRTSSDIIQSQANEGHQTKLPKQYRFHPVKSHGFTVIQQKSQNDKNTIIQTASPIKNIITNEKNFLPNQIERNTSNNHTSILNELFNELNACQKKQIFLLKQIQQLINQSDQISSSTFFLPLNNNNNNNILSLQDSFQQRKSSFIQQSKKRVHQIYCQKNKFHHRIIPNIKQTNNTYLQEKRKYENDRLCAMIIKHQNRQNAKIYGNLIKNQLCHN